MARAHFDGSCEDNLQFLVLVRGMCDHNEPNSNKDEQQYRQCTRWTQDSFWKVWRDHLGVCGLMRSTSGSEGCVCAALGADKLRARACVCANVAQSLDDAAAAAGDTDTNFVDGAAAMETASVLVATAFALMMLAGMLLLPASVSWECSKSVRGMLVAAVLVCALATTAMTVAAIILTVTSSQLNADHWESATGCATEVTWDDGLECLIASLPFVLIATVCIVFGPTPEQHLLEPNWFVRRALSLELSDK